MKKGIGILFCALLVLIPGSALRSWELLDRVIAVVNETPIIQSEVEKRFTRLKESKRIARKKRTFEKSRVLDQYIENAIVRQVADEESIIVSDKKIENQIEKIMKRTNIKSLKEFQKKIEKREKIPFEEYKEELRISLYREQVISIAIGVSPPSSKEARKWYKSNKKKLGYEVHIKHILIRPKNRGFAEEKRVNKIIKGIRSKIVSGQSFEALARKHSQDYSTAKKGGDIGWKLLAEMDPYFASQVFRMRRRGQISQVIKSGYGYHIVKFLQKRVTAFDTVRDKIYFMLFQKKMGVQFKKWVAQKKSESDIKIFMENYVKG